MRASLDQKILEGKVETPKKICTFCKDKIKYRFTIGGDVFKVINWLAWTEGNVARLVGQWDA